VPANDPLGDRGVIAVDGTKVRANADVIAATGCETLARTRKQAVAPDDAEHVTAESVTWRGSSIGKGHTEHARDGGARASGLARGLRAAARR
jgi:hypothetical protein